MSYWLFGRTRAGHAHCPQSTSQISSTNAAACCMHRASCQHLLPTMSVQLPDRDISILHTLNNSCAVSLYCLCVHPNHLCQCVQGYIPDVVVPVHQYPCVITRTLRDWPTVSDHTCRVQMHMTFMKASKWDHHSCVRLFLHTSLGCGEQFQDVEIQKCRHAVSKSSCSTCLPRSDPVY